MGRKPPLLKWLRFPGLFLHIGSREEDEPSMFSHLYSADLKEALKKEGCAICRLCADDLPRYYFWLLEQDYYTSLTLDRLKRAGGFCPPHAWELAELKQPFVAGVMYQWLTKECGIKLQALLDEAQKNQTIKRIFSFKKERSLRRHKEYLKSSDKCPTCHHLAYIAESRLRMLIKLLKTEEMRSLLSSSSGLCWSHFQMAISLARRDTLQFLAKDQLIRLESLCWSFGEYFRKVEYRFSNEPKGEEQKAWSRAIELFAGSKDGVSLRTGRLVDKRLTLTELPIEKVNIK